MIYHHIPREWADSVNDAERCDARGCQQLAFWMREDGWKFLCRFHGASTHRIHGVPDGWTIVGKAHL